jgi:hypothetical protein
MGNYLQNKTQNKNKNKKSLSNKPFLNKKIANVFIGISFSH